MTGRLRLIFLFLIVAFLAVVARLFYWQVVKAEELSFLGRSQYGTVVKIPAKRGEIRTSDNFPIAANKISYLLFVNPKEIKKVSETSLILSSLLEMDVASISASLSKNLLWVPIKTGISAEKKDEIAKLSIPGIGFQEESSRLYPEASIAAHLLGFVGKNDAGLDKGYFGLEGYYDRQLKGKDGEAIQIRDALGKPIISRMDGNSISIDGRSLILSVNRTIQFLAENKLKKGIEQYGAAGGMVGIMNPKTGEILAMASFPSFDQANFKDFPEESYKNPFISNLYEPGSTFKALVMASGIDSKVVKPDTKCPVCAGPLSISGYEIRTWNNKYQENITMKDVIKNSDNTGMVYVQRSLGLPKFLSYLKKFGIGDDTNIDLQGEVYQSLREEDMWYPLDAATASFGQGITVTPIELLTAFSAIANDGKRMEPHVVSKIETPEGEDIFIKPKVVETPISPTTAKIMTELLVNAVKSGEAKWTSMKGYRVAGKTGTAQIPIAGHYDPNKTIASFIGFAPADNPKFAMLVIVDRPTTSIYGADTAAPIFFDIARDILTYYDIPPTE